MTEQSISYQGTDLSNTKATMKESGVGDDAVLLLRRKVNVTGMRVHGCFLGRPLDNVLHLFNSSESREIERDAEMMRLQILGDPRLMQQLREVPPHHRFSAPCVQTWLTTFILRHNQNWLTPHNLTPPSSTNYYASSAKCRRMPKSNVNGR